MRQPSNCSKNYESEENTAAHICQDNNTRISERKNTYCLEYVVQLILLKDGQLL